MVDAFQRMLIHLLFMVLIVVTVPIAILAVLVALARECVFDRRREARPSSRGLRPRLVKPGVPLQSPLGG